MSPKDAADLSVDLAALESTVDGLRETIEKQLEARDVALQLAAAAMQGRFDRIEELRQRVAVDQERMATKADLAAEVKAVDAELRVLRDFKIQVESKASIESVNRARGVAYFGAILSVIALLANLLKMVIEK